MKNRNVINIFKALGNERRFLIVAYLLKNKELTVGEISKLIDLSFRSTSKHLTVLMNMDLVQGKQVSINKFYSIDRTRFPAQFIRFFKS